MNPMIPIKNFDISQLYATIYAMAASGNAAKIVKLGDTNKVAIASGEKFIVGYPREIDVVTSASGTSAVTAKFTVDSTFDFVVKLNGTKVDVSTSSTVKANELKVGHLYTLSIIPNAGTVTITDETANVFTPPTAATTN